MQTVSLCKHILRKAPNPGNQRTWLLKSRVKPMRALSTQGGVEGVMGSSKGKDQRKQSMRVLGNSTSFVQVLGNGTDTGDTCPSVLLFFEQQRFVFNVGEGFQRYCFQHKIKMGKVKHFFLTRMSTEACGGVPGLVLTLTEHGIGGMCSGSGGITLHGPQNSHKLLEAIKTFVPLSGQELTVSNFGALRSDQPGVFLAPLVDEPNVKIQPLFLQPELSSNEAVSPPDSDGEGLSDGSRKKAKVEGRSTVRRTVGVPAACYLCHLSENKGKFYPEKAMALGIKPGPAYSELQNGQSVTNADGIEVHSHEVMSAGTPGPILVVVDCPDGNYLSSLCQASGFSPWLDKELKDGQALVMIHLGPADVVSSNLYASWVGRFPKGTDHIFVNLETCQSSAVLRKSAVVQTKLNFVDDHIFPLPAVLSSPSPLNSSTYWEREGFVLGKDLLKYWLKPVGRKGVDKSEVLEPFSLNKVREDFEAQCTDAVAAIRNYKDVINTKEASTVQPQKIAADELEVTFLGTGSALPSKYRNVTCIYLDFYAKGSMLLDCGEGSYGQLIRRFGIQGAKDALRKLKCVWISHIHADHHAGLPRFLSARQRTLGDNATPVLVIGPPGLRRTLLEFAKLEPISYHYLISNSVATMNQNGGPIKLDTTKAGVKRSSGPPKGSLDAFQAAKRDLGLTALDSFFVKHCSNAFGLKLESNNWKVVFTGDAMPCDSVIKAAENATLLIHEATFEEDMAEEALRKKHSTTKDALEASVKSRSQYTILTHFSQRYPKVPVLTESSEVSSRVGIAFDLMSVNLADLDRVPLVVQPCMHLFEEEAAEADENDEAVLSA